MDLAPATVTPELASAALASPVLADLFKFAEWVGDGKALTSDGFLPPDLMAQARELLGLDPPEDVDLTEDDGEDLDFIWDAAQEAGFITVSGDLAKAADQPTEPDDVLRRWLSVALAPYGIPDNPSAEWVTVLAALADEQEPVSMLALIEETSSDFQSLDEDDDEEEYHEHLDGLIGHVTVTVMSLRDLSAVSVVERGKPDQYTVRLTPLGRMLADTVFTALTPVPDEMAGAVVHRFGQLTPRIAARIAGPWLAGRPIADVAAELLDFAAYARADQRLIAVGYVNTLGPDAAPAWRERVKDRGVGVYARTWLAEHGENVSLDGREADWMQVEKFSGQVAAMPQSLLVGVLADLAAHEPDALPELRRALSRSRHPDAPKLMDVIAQATGRSAATARFDPPPVPGEATGTSYRIRVSLRYVQSPPVWRTIAVDAGTTLAELHEIIQAAMGWRDEHLHGFGFGADNVNEAAPLGRLLRKPGDRILYTYDFGDDWEHDIILKDIDHNNGGDSLPVLLDGQGACPPEDCGGAPGYLHLKEVMADPRHKEHEEMADWLAASSFDPDEFEFADGAAAVNAVGSGLRPQPRPVAVVRTQPKRKKRRR